MLEARDRPLRLFVALPAPVGARDRLLSAQRELDALGLPVHWSPEAKLHLTLAFVGEAAPSEIEVVRRAVDGAAEKTAPFRVDLAGLGSFPLDAPPQVIWAGVDTGAARLAALQRRLALGLRGTGGRDAAWPFHAHVTLGTVAEAWSDDQLQTWQRAGGGTPAPYGTWLVDRVHVFQSNAGAAAGSYTSVHTASLGGAH